MDELPKSAFEALAVPHKPGLLDRVNDRVKATKVGRLFELTSRKTTFTQELCAAITVFLTVASIIAVNPAILAASGGPCSVADCTGPFMGTDKCRRPNLDKGYAACVSATSQAIVASTCLSAAIGCFLMALLANMPLILSPGMGVNAFFTFAIVGQYGSGGLTYQQGMAVVLVTSLLVLLATMSGLRGRIMMLFPTHLVFGMVVGLGLFLALTGLRSGTGIGLVVASPETLLTAGGCPERNQVHALVLAKNGLAADAAEVLQQALLTDTYGCHGGVLQSAKTWLGIAATLLILLLMAAKVDGAIAWGVLFATVIAWIPGHRASFFTGDSGAADRYMDFKKVVSLPNPSKVALQFDFSAFQKSEAFAAMFALFYLVFLDSTGTAFALAGAIDTHLPGFLKPGFVFPRRMATLFSDGLACIVGAMLGTSPLIVAAESSVAVEQGGRTGLVPLATGCMFLFAMFFAPLFSNIPPYATGPALIVVGSLMASTARFIAWGDIQEAFPAFITMAIMPFTYSISNGLLAGIAATFALWVLDLSLGLARAVISKDPDSQTPGAVLKDKFATWRAAFGDLSWGAYKAELMETFERVRSNMVLRRSSALTRLRTSMRRFDSSELDMERHSSELGLGSPMPRSRASSAPQLTRGNTAGALLGPAASGAGAAGGPAKLLGQGGVGGAAAATSRTTSAQPLPELCSIAEVPAAGPPGEYIKDADNMS